MKLIEQPETNNISYICFDREEARLLAIIVGNCDWQSLDGPEEGEYSQIQDDFWEKIHAFGDEDDKRLRAAMKPQKKTTKKGKNK